MRARKKETRPAEVAGAGATLSAIVVAGIAGEWEFAAGGAAGMVPAVVTWIVARGGLRPVLRSFIGR